MEKGLCFRCDKKFVLGHRWQFRQLRIMITGEEGREEEGDDEVDGREESAPVEECEMEATLNSSSVMGFNTPKRMKATSLVEGKKVVVLLDSGTTLNFISEKLVRELNLPVQPTKFVVILGDDRRVGGLGRCDGVVVNVQGVQIIQNFLPFQLGVVDIIVGMDWLSRLGEVKINWKNQTMKFLWEGKKVEIKGDVSLTCLEASLKTDEICL